MSKPILTIVWVSSGYDKLTYARKLATETGRLLIELESKMS